MEADRTPLLVAEAGVPYAVRPQGDPIAAWLDLMDTMEALCPRWPVVESRVGGVYRL